MAKLYSFKDHPEHEAQLGAWRDRWIANALNTTPMDDNDREQMREAVRLMYDAAKLEQPRNIVFAAGPISGAIAAGVAMGVWFLRECEDKRHVDMFGRRLDDAEVLAAVPAACEYAVSAAMGNPKPALQPASDSIYAATSAATDAATYAATRAATYAATSAATYAATRAATDAATDAATSAATRAATSPDNLIRFLTWCVGQWFQMYQGGNTWSGWDSYLSFFRDVAKLELPVHAQYKGWELGARHGGWRFMHKRFVIVCDRPLEIHRDERARPHRVGGPFTRWADGFELYYVAGVKVERSVAMGTFEPRAVLDEDNTEVRRIMVDVYDRLHGKGAWLVDIGAKTLHEDADPLGRPRTLVSARLGDDEPYVAIRLVNSTPELDANRKPLPPDQVHGQLWIGPWLDEAGVAHERAAFKYYTIRVDPNLRPLPPAGQRPSGRGQAMTCHNAVASLHGKRGSDYAPHVET
jgi:hypothetical protein